MTVVTHLSSSPGPSLGDVIAGVLTKDGPMTEDQLVAALHNGGVDLGVDPEDVLGEALDDSDGLLVQLDDERWASLPALLAGRVLTHRLTGPEVEHDILDPTLDFIVIDMLVERPEYQRLTDGSPVIPVVPPYYDDTLAERGIPADALGDLGAWVLPRGYLRDKGMGEGDVIALRVTDAGLLLEAAPAQETPAERSAALGRALNAVLDVASEVPLSLDTAVWTACAEDPGLFVEPLPPLGEALEACGLVYDEEWLAPAGFDLPQWWRNARQGAIARRHLLDHDRSLVVVRLVSAYEQIADGELTDVPEAATVAMLADPAIAAAVLAEVSVPGQESAVGLFAEALEPHAPRAALPALRWLRGKAFERLGDLAKAEAAYRAAETLDPQWPPALVDLARYAGDRGDAPAGLALLRRADAPPEHPLVVMLEHFQVEPRTDLGRNDPCWCGSGRKYKKCHLNRESLTLNERASWLYQKAVLVLDDGPWGVALIGVAQTRADFSDNTYTLLDALEDPVTPDVVLFEGGAFTDFLAARGALLPEDERLLAEQWLLVERSVYEVEEVHRGEGLTLRDVRTGDVHQVRERAGSRQLEAGSLICARVVPADDIMQIFGGIEPVALHQRDELVALLDSEPDPIELISFLSRRFAPFAVENTEGDPLVLCEVTLKVEDSAALIDELDETYERDAGTQEWTEFVTTNGTKHVRATLRLDGHHLTVQANSEARADRVLTVLRALAVRLTVVGDSRQPARDTREAAAIDDPAGSTASLDPADPAVAAVLSQFIRDYEQKWLDQPIPALAGYTPRQAAADPTRRGDLIRLLDSFPGHRGDPGVMDTDRLRAALDLE